MNTSTAALPTAAHRREVAAFGMWVFLASEVLFFGVLLVVYGVARAGAPAGFAAASAKASLVLGTLNTAVLLTSSGAIAVAASAAQAGSVRVAKRCLIVAATLGLVFLAIKGIEYRSEWREGLFPGPGFAIDGRVVPGAELFFAWYFVVTALHALHLAIGIGLCAATARAASPAPARVHVIALYWHFVDVVWVLLYPLIYLVGPR